MFAAKTWRVVLILNAPLLYTVGECILSRSIKPKTFGLYPNGLGYFETWVSSRMSQATGVFVQSSFPYTSDLSTGTLTGFGGFSFSLQKSNPIFGSSSKVQPRACQLLMIIKS